MPTFPSISVVIPAYNRANTIRRCLDSILAQTILPLEILVVDDCSTDATYHLVESYNDPRIRCMALDKNSGAQAARNFGIKKSKGEWIAFQDSDDEWLPGKLERQIEALSERQFDPWVVVHTNALCRGMSRTRGALELPIVEGADVYHLLLTKPGPLFPGLIVSRLALDRINFLDENIRSYQEWDTSIRLARYCRFVFLRETLFIYNLDTNDSISNERAREISGYQQVIDKFKEEIIRECGKTVWENHLYIQLIKCLDYGLWSEADGFLRMISSGTIKYRLFKIFRLFHVSPDPAIHLLRLLRNSISKGRIAL